MLTTVSVTGGKNKTLFIVQTECCSKKRSALIYFTNLPDILEQNEVHHHVTFERFCHCKGTKRLSFPLHKKSIVSFLRQHATLLRQRSQNIMHLKVSRSQRNDLLISFEDRFRKGLQVPTSHRVCLLLFTQVLHCVPG